LHVASPPASQNEKKRKLQLQTMLGSFLLLWRTFAPILKNKLRTKFWF
jgi:hypothetical protein